MNTSPPVESPSSSRDNPCFGHDAQIAALNVLVDDGTSYLLPYAQFLYAEGIANPILENKPDAPPEKLLICFASANVTLLGSGLAAIGRAIQRYELKFVKSADRRFAGTLKTYVASVAINLTKDKA
jgi:hypothetical protein